MGAKMRVLFTTLPGFGHWHPLILFAAALRAAGHEVAFATTPAACAAIDALGFRCFPAGSDETATEARVRRERMASLGSESPTWVLPNLFAGAWAADRLPGLLTICASWQPTLLVRENMEFAGCIAAERLGLPHATVQVAAWRPQTHPLIVAPLNRLRDSVGLPPDHDLTMLHRYLLIVPAPPSYQDAAAPLPATAHAVRHVAFDRSGLESLPAWVNDLPDRPAVYATMGTVFNQVPGILEAILAGLREEPITLIMTTGRDQDPGTFGRQPPHVHIERYVPQSLLFPHCDVVVNHGGTGTVRSALSHGLPMVLIPVSADQPDNARRCADLGVGRVIDPEDRSPGAIQDAVRTVLTDPSYHQNAVRLRDESAALPGMDHAVDLLVRLGVDRQLLVSSPPG